MDQQGQLQWVLMPPLFIGRGIDLYLPSPLPIKMLQWHYIVVCLQLCTLLAP